MHSGTPIQDPATTSSLSCLSGSYLIPSSSMMLAEANRRSPSYYIPAWQRRILSTLISSSASISSDNGNALRFPQQQEPRPRWCPFFDVSSPSFPSTTAAAPSPHISDYRTCSSLFCIPFLRLSMVRKSGLHRGGREYQIWCIFGAQTLCRLGPETSWGLLGVVVIQQIGWTLKARSLPDVGMGGFSELNPHEPLEAAKYNCLDTLPPVFGEVSKR